MHVQQDSRWLPKMPFYIVTYTALVDAEDEVDAAEKAMNDLQVKPQLKFAVKFDESSIKHVSVRRQTTAVGEEQGVQAAVASDAEVSSDISGVETKQEDQSTPEKVANATPSSGAIGAILLALSFAGCVLFGLFHFSSFQPFQ